jgi:hypothetical protein
MKHIFCLFLIASFSMNAFSEELDQKGKAAIAATAVGGVSAVAGRKLFKVGEARLHATSSESLFKATGNGNMSKEAVDEVVKKVSNMDRVVVTYSLQTLEKPGTITMNEIEANKTLKNIISKVEGQGGKVLSVSRISSPGIKSGVKLLQVSVVASAISFGSFLGAIHAGVSSYNGAKTSPRLDNSDRAFVEKTESSSKELKKAYAVNKQ